MKVIQSINNTDGYRSVASCSGHGKYHPTIFIGDRAGKFYEWYSGRIITPIKRRYLCFYERDEEGLYFNAEVEAFYKNVVK